MCVCACLSFSIQFRFFSPRKIFSFLLLFLLLLTWWIFVLFRVHIASSNFFPLAFAFFFRFCLLVNTQILSLCLIFFLLFFLVIHIHQVFCCCCRRCYIFLWLINIIKKKKHNWKIILSIFNVFLYESVQNCLFLIINFVLFCFNRFFSLVLFALCLILRFHFQLVWYFSSKCLSLSLVLLLFWNQFTGTHKIFSCFLLSLDIKIYYEKTSR